MFVALLTLGAVLWILFGYFGVQALFTNRVVDERVPVQRDGGATSTPSIPIIMARGVFQQGDNPYSVQGVATIMKTDQGRVLSLTDFRVTNGPDLFVYLVSADEAENKRVKEAVRQNRFVNLGALKGNQGNQIYRIPDEVHLDDSSIISVWCRRFSRNFGAASLDLESTP